MVILFIGAILLYCFIFPGQFGIVGRKIKGFFAGGFGQGMFLVPLFLALLGVSLFRNKKVQLVQYILSISLVLLTTSFLSMVSRINYGGRTGKFLCDNVFVNFLGPAGGFIAVSLGIILLLSALLRISLLDLARLAAKRLRDDWEEWRKTRELVKKIQINQMPVQPRIPFEAEDRPKQKPEQKVARAAEAPVAPVRVAEREPARIEKIAGQKEGKKAEKEAVKTEVVQPEIYTLPSLELLATSTQLDKNYKQDDLIVRAALLEKTLADFNVQIKVTDISSGPAVTTYFLTPEPGVKITQITALADDIALALKTPNARIVAPVPGKGTVAVEVPNPHINVVGIRDIISSMEFQKSESKLAIALGKTADGKPYVTDLIPMPHLLIAGATGSGKSVCIHSIIASILYKAKPDEVKFMLIDPKRLELPAYDSLPHLYDPRVTPDKVKVITQPKLASESLKCLVRVMENRYEKFAKVTVRNIDGYNEYAAKAGIKKEYYIVVIIDELADLMLTVPKEVEDSIQRLAQMARAVGIHLILATQRPSVDVITGVIKANLSARIAFQVLSKVDSRVILDTMGADDLIGRGDMLFLPSGSPKPMRLQGSYVSEKEVEDVIKFIENQKFKPDYEEGNTLKKEEKEKTDEKSGEYLKEALELIMERKRVSQDLLKARFGSSARASDILSLLEVRGYINKPEGTNRWQILFDKIEDYLKSGTGE